MSSEQSLLATHVTAAAAAGGGVGGAATAAIAGMGNVRVYDGKIAGLYDLEETLGSGHFAVVKLARHVFTGAKVAVKVVDKTKLDEVSKAHLFQEVRCMKLVQHPNVVRLYEVIDTATKLYLVLELGDGGDLYDYIMKHDGGLSEDLARKYFRQILRAISYCHQLHVVHRDLKPENVVFFEKLGVVKLTDFGFSNKFSPGQKLETFCGSLAYSAPEILLGDSYDAPAVDIWSLGVILYMLVCGQPPFEKANDSETLTMIMDCKYSVPPQITKPCQKLIASMLVRDPKKRATLEQIAHDPWLKVEDECDGVAEFLPLVSREEISEEDHNFIIQKMINGNIACKEAITQSLDKNQYNHITATYFLLAEIRLRKRREELSKKQQLAEPNKLIFRKMGDTSKNLAGGHQKAVVGTLRIPNIVCLPASFDSDVATDKRTRKCSIVREEEEDETGYDNTVKGNELKVAITRRESISDGRLNQSVQEHALAQCRPTTALPVPTTNISTKANNTDETIAQTILNINRHSVVLLDDKCIAVEDKLSSGMHGTIKGLKELKLLQANSNKNSVLTHRRMKLNKIRTPSCSSSEASDDDTKTRNKKKLNKLVGDAPVRFQMHRRDSHDDSSDSQDQAFPSSSSTAAAHLIAAKTAGSGSGSGNGENGKKDKDKDNSSNGKTQKGKKQSKDNAEKSMQQTQKLQSYTTTSAHGRRRRIRESQSLDRINEELELRHRYFPLEAHAEQKHQQQIIHGTALIETKAEYDDDSKLQHHQHQQQQQQYHIHNTASLQTLEATETLLQLKLGRNKLYNMNSIEEVDMLLKQQQTNATTAKTLSAGGGGTKCIVSIKRIRRLGKYFPVVNFS